MAKEWIVENTWNCSVCRKLNKGRDLNCRGCGCRKSLDTEDIIGHADEAITDRALLAQANAGMWVCGFCGCQERTLEGNCSHCGGGQEHKDSSPRKKTSSTRLEPSVSGRPGDPSYWGTRRGKIMYAGWIVVGLLLGALLVKAIWWLVTPREVDARVVQTSWKHTENLRERETRSGEGWGRPGTKGFYNEAAFNVSCHQRYYGEERCHPHDCNPRRVTYECRCTTYDCNCRNECSDNKNGYSTCRRVCSSCKSCDTCSRTEYDTCYDSCPVYKDWCSYSYHEWPVKETKESFGYTHDVSWPGLLPNPQRSQRVQRVAQYQVLFRDSAENSTLTYEPTELAVFKQFFVDDTWKLEVGKVTGKVNPVKRITAEAE